MSRSFCDRAKAPLAALGAVARGVEVALHQKAGSGRLAACLSALAGLLAEADRLSAQAEAMGRQEGALLQALSDSRAEVAALARVLASCREELRLSKVREEAAVEARRVALQRGRVAKAQADRMRGELDEASKKLRSK